MSRPIGTLGVIPTLTVGGLVYTDLTNLIQISGFVNNAGGSAFTSPRKANSTSGYQVTAGKTLIITAVRFVDQSNAVGGGITLGYNDSDLGILAAGPAVSPVYFAGSPTFSVLTADISTGQYEAAIPPFSIPAGKYAFLQNLSTAGGMITLFGYEV